MEKMNIRITGPQGTGKTLIALVIGKILCNLGAHPMVWDGDLDMAVNCPLDVEILKRVFKDQKVFIRVENAPESIKTGSGPLSVDNALELLLAPDQKAVLS